MAAEAPRYGVQPRPRRRSVSPQRGRTIGGWFGDPTRLRVIALMAIAALLAVAVWSRLIYWQVAQHSYLSGVAIGQYSKTVVLPASRGVVYDRSGRPLAVDTAVYSVFVAPTQVSASARPALADALSGTLAIPRDKVMSILASGSQFAYLARRVPQATADHLRAMQLPSVGLQQEAQRSYLPGALPGTSLAANLLGFVNNDGAGQYGVEAYYDKALRGQDGSQSTYTDLANRQIVLGNRTTKAAVDGQSLTLTIDSSIQYAAEQAIAEGVQRNKGESGSILVMDPHTGGIVAWADYPTYDANNFAQTDVSKFVDPIVSGLYEPGSVMKTVTLAGAIDAKAITPQYTFNDPGVVSVGGFAIRDWDQRAHGNVSMTYVLEHSLNVGAIKAMQLETPQTYYQYLQSFGFGHASGVDVAGEPVSALALKPFAQWPDSQVATASFGQGIGVNMVQMLSAVNVIANGGRYVAPHVVASVGSHPIAAPASHQVVSADTASQMTRMMESVVQYGSGHEARINGFQLDETGKTGTSQIPVNGQYTQDVWSSYVGFMPAQNPAFTMLVLIRKPHNTNGWESNDGYIVAAPVWKQVAQAMVLQWAITPDRNLAPQPN